MSASPLETAKKIFEYVNAHPVSALFRAKAKEDYGFYDGTDQWPAPILQDLMDRGQTPVTVNKVKNLINHMAGVEIQTRFRVAFRSHSEADADLAKAITHLSYAIQESQEMPYKASLKFKDALITGIGWSNLYQDPITQKIGYDYVHPFNVFFDPDDLSPDFSEMSYVVRLRWLPKESAQSLWPRHKGYFNEMMGSSLEGGNASDELSLRLNGVIESYVAGGASPASRILIVEVQYKANKDAYLGVDEEGRSFETFNRQEAQDLSASASEKKDPDAEEALPLQKKPATQILRTLFTGNLLLEHGPLHPPIPNLKDFSYIPLTWTRRTKDGLPEGWLSVMKDIQRESNYRRTKLVHNLNSFRAIIDGNVFPEKNPEEIRMLLKRPDAVLVKGGQGELLIESNQGLAHGQFEMLARGDKELYDVTGISPDALGQPTNARSAVAMERRQINSVRSQVFAFDALRSMKKREARMLLNLLQNGGYEYLQAPILEGEEREVFLLNIVRDVNGKKVIFNDIRNLSLTLYVEEVPDFESAAEEQQEVFSALLGNANAPLIMQSPEFMKRLGIREYAKIAEEMQELSAQQSQSGQQIAPQPKAELR